MNRLDMMTGKHIVIDLETVDKLPTAGILSIGAVLFTPEKILDNGGVDRSFYVNVDVESCITYGMTFSWDTLYWWFNQSKEAGEALQEDKKYIINALTDLDRFINDNRTAYYWGNPNKFDISILENAYRLCGMKEIWTHKEVIDLVTLEAIIGTDNKEIIKKELQIGIMKSGVKHDALYDAEVEAHRISQALGLMPCLVK